MMRRVVRDLAFVGAADALKCLRLLIVLPLLTRSLGADAYGVWSQIKVNAAFLGSLASLGMTAALVRFLSGEGRPSTLRDGFNSALWTGVAGSAVFGALLLAWPATIAVLTFGGADATVFVVATAVYLVLDVVDLLVLAYLRLSRQMGFHFTAIAVEVIGEVVVVWSMIAQQFALVEVVSAIIAWKAAVVLVKLGITWWQLGIAPPRLSIVQRYLALGIPLTLSGVSYLILNYGDRYFISVFMGISSVGMYAAAYAVGTIPIMLSTPIDYVLYPSIAGEWNAGRTAEATRQIDMMLQWLVILLTPIVAMLAVLVVPIMATLATPAFLPVAPVALVVAVSFAMFHIGIVGERVLVLAHRPRSVTLIYVGMAVVNAVLNVMLVPRLGLIGAAVATLASFGLYSTVTLVKARKHCQFHFPLSTLVRSAFAAAVGAAVASQLAGEGVPRIVFAAVAGGLVYTAMLVAVGGVPLSTLRTWMRPISDAG